MIKLLNKFADRISYNFFGFSGLIIFFPACVFLWNAVFRAFVLDDYRYSMAGFLYFMATALSVLACVLITLILLILEEIFDWRIKCKIVLSNKFLILLRTLGTLHSIIIFFWFAIFNVLTTVFNFG